MAITAETRKAIIELVVTAYDAAPGTTLLTELVAIVDGGGSLADVATNLTTRTEWTSKYPSFQTAGEFGDEWLGALVPEASAESLAAGVVVVEGLVAGGSTFGEIIIAAQGFLAALPVTDAAFGTSAANFTNKVAVATYQTITLEQAGAGSLAGVTSDVATVATVNAAATTTANDVAGSVVSLTTGTDFITGTAGNDTINAVQAGAAANTETYSPVDQIDGGAGTDTLYVETDSSLSFATVTNVENLQISANTGPVTITLANDAAYKELHSLNSTTNVTFNNIASGDVNGAIIATANASDTTYNYRATALTGAADNLDVMLSAADGDLVITGGTAANALETITLNSVSDGELNDVTLTNANTTKLVFTGAGAANIRGITGAAATLNTYDASAATGNITVTGQNTASNTIMGGAGDDTLGGAAGNDQITGGAGNDQITGGAGNDHIDGGAGDDTVVLTNATLADTVAGGEGTDVLSLGAAVGYSATVNDGVGITGFETIRTTGALTQDMLGLAGNTITKAVTGSNSAVTLRETAITSVDASTSGANGTLSISQATDGAADAMAVTLGSVLGVSAAQVTLNTVDSETVTVDSVGANGNTLTLGNNTAGKTATATAAAVAAAAATATDLTSITITGSKNLTVNASSKNTALATVNADAFTGDTLSVVAGSGTTQAAMTVTAPNTSATITTGKGADTVTVGDGGTAQANNITTGDGADTIVSGAGADTINSGDDGGSITSGAGNDTITSGDGVDTITLGAGDDTVTSSGAAADIIDGGEGNDTVTTAGAGADSITGGAGNDNLTGGADNDTVLGGTGNDTLSGGSGADSIDGGAGNDNLTDGTGNDTVIGGEGNDTITISSGNDNVSGGAGNDTLTITGLSAADTIDGGAGTDSLTVTNASGGSLAPTFTSIESLAVNTSSNFVLVLTNATDTTSLKTYTITSTDSTAADDITLTDIASGSTVNLSDDSTWDGAATASAPANTGDIGVVSIDTTAGGILTLNVSANEDAATHVATAVTTSTTIGDASTVTINSKNSDANDIVNDLTSLVLDTTETQSLTLVAEDSAGIDTGNITTSAAMQSLTLSSAAGAVSTIGTVATTTGLETLSIASTGAGSSASIGDIAANNITEAQLTSLTISAGGSSTTTVQDIFSDQSSALTAVSITANGANSTIDLTADTGLDFGTGTIGALTIGVADNSSLLFDAQSIISGAITTASLTVGDYATVADSGVNGEDLTITGASTTFNLSLGRGITNAAGDDIIVSGAVTTLALSSALNAESMALASTNILTYGGNALIDFGTVGKSTYTHTGTGSLDWQGSNIATSNAITSNSTSSTADTLVGGAGNDTLTGNAGANTLTGNALNDSLTGNLGADTLTGGAGNDTINVTESTQSADTIVINAVTAISSDSNVNAGTSAANADDTGDDIITGFDAGSDVIKVVATAVVNYNHTSALSVGTGVDGVVGTATAVDAFVKNTLLINLDATAAVNNVGDIVLGFSNFALNGVSQLGAADFLTVADVDQSIQYNITGTTAVNTIVGGDQADTITGGTAADVITGGGGADDIVYAAAGDSTISNTIITAILAGNAGIAANSIAGVDKISGFATGVDDIDISAIANGTAVMGSSSVTAAAGGSDANWKAILNTSAAASGGGTNTVIEVFSFSGNQYVVIDNSNATIFAAGDMLIQLTGTPLAAIGGGVIGDFII